MQKLQVSKSGSNTQLRFAYTLKTKVSKPKAAIVHAKVSLTLRISEISPLKIQVGKPKAEVKHAEILLTLRISKNTLTKPFVGHACISSGLQIKQFRDSFI